MTMIAVILVGIGGLLVVSAIENESIYTTYTNIVTGNYPHVSGSSGTGGGGKIGAG